MRRRKRGKKGPSAELLFEKWLSSRVLIYHRARAAKIGKFTQAHDLFKALDFLSFSLHRPPWTENIVEEIYSWGVQITTQKGRSARRRKIESVPWPDDYVIHLVSHEVVDDPANRTKSLHYWKFEPYEPTERRWWDPIAVQFNPAKTEEEWKETRCQT